jgi:hypothetical protein
MKCPECENTKLKSNCNFCWGKNKLDWIESIFGVEFDYELVRDQCITSLGLQLREHLDKMIVESFSLKPELLGIKNEVPKMQREK